MTEEKQPAKTNAQRQRDYRLKRKLSREGEGGEVRLSMYISFNCKVKLEHLANHHGVTYKEVIETLITNESNRLLAPSQDTKNTPNSNLKG